MAWYGPRGGFHHHHGFGGGGFGMGPVIDVNLGMGMGGGYMGGGYMGGGYMGGGYMGPMYGPGYIAPVVGPSICVCGEGAGVKDGAGFTIAPCLYFRHAWRRILPHASHAAMVTRTRKLYSSTSEIFLGRSPQNSVN